MSFYGNSYYYTAESFARIILQNTGINITSTPNPSDLIVNLEPIDAVKRDSGIKIENSNRWIGLQLNDTGDGFKISHNAAGCAEGELPSAILPFQIITESEIPAGTTPVPIKFNDCIGIALVEYDKAGHIINSSPLTYLRMPANPGETFQSDINTLLIRMNTIDGADNEPTGSDCLVATLNTRMDEFNTWEADIQTALSNSQSASENALNALEDAADAVNNAKAAVATAANFAEDINRLQGDINTIKEQLKS